ncbi:hypothetical protein N7481_003995 [Penicillium waksmanii]|uniref:uncharacterized protein n=1 Tax=Penicillium waksmanii TaxID=69791 RepID=UPI00254815B2|nr:uncharacterized protein N7481_003995 [Penicillium waksmanii]KAJ5988785.1 hypothetical protein N7481_003995 [Penicillium waksmanii]
MASRSLFQSPSGPSYSLYTILWIFFLSLSAVANALAYPPQKPLAETRPVEESLSSSLDDLSDDASHRDSNATPAETLQDLLSALRGMQDHYFVMWMGTWPSSIDWTAAVLGTHVVATLSSYTSSKLDVVDPTESHQSVALAVENTVNQFFTQMNTFYFGENAFSLRNQAYDDMLWVVLDWLENVKFQDLHTDLHFPSSDPASENSWYGTQFRQPAAHRARIFYELASAGWDKTLCGGGDDLEPGDPIDSPFIANAQANGTYPHNPAHLKAAVDAYAWLKNSNMTGAGGLYADGFHISGWRSASDPGTGKCDELNKMVYTYNQGVVLSGLRGLWIGTGDQSYLRDGHELVHKVLRATGWPQTSSKKWAGLGRGGVLEEACDSYSSCSQNGQTFKGIFFHHLAEFCRPLRPQEERFLAAEKRQPIADESWENVYTRHLKRCRTYGPWIEHNARAALITRDDDGKFGTWWGIEFQQPPSVVSAETVNSSTLPAGAVDYRNVEFETDASTFDGVPRDFNDRGRGRTVETQSGGIAVLRALYQWQTSVLL